MNYGFPDTPEGYWRLDGTILPNAADAIPQFVKKLISMNNQQPTNAKLIVGEDQWQQIKTQYGSCSKFAWNGSGLRFPEINCFVQGLNSINQLTTMMEAGLPNITGYVTAIVQGQDGWRVNTGGAITWDRYTINSDGGENRDGGTINFDASRSNSIYGKSTTVQPTSVRYPYIISIYNKIQNAANLDLQQIIEDSVNKANINLDNLDQDGITYLNNKVLNVGATKFASMPNYNAGWSVSNGTTYTYDYPVWLGCSAQAWNYQSYLTINGVQYYFGGWLGEGGGCGSFSQWFIPAGISFRGDNLKNIFVWPCL